MSTHYMKVGGYVSFPRPSERPSLNLIATVGKRLTSEPVERLGSVADFQEWVALEGLPLGAVSAKELDDAKLLREAIYTLLTASALTALTDSSSTRDALAVINQAANAPTRLSFNGEHVELSGESSPSAVLTLIARDAVELLARAGTGNLTQCEAPDCGSWFQQSLQGRHRRWCTTNGCGNRARVAAHRERAGR